MMIRSIGWVIFFFLFLVMHSQCKSSDGQRKVIRVAAASNNALVMRDLIAAWEEETGFKVDLITGSSGKITAQIFSGAPYDVFVSADRKYLYDLQRKELIEDSISTIGYGQLAYIWTEEDSDIEKLLSKADHIAIANPEVAPYGKSALAYLSEYHSDDSLRAKMIYGENVAQVYQYVHSGAAELGITAVSLLLPDNRHEMNWSLLEEDYDLIEQSVGILSFSPLKERAEKFVSFLVSRKASEILESYGYLPNS